jgi:hypothetical protein
MQEKRFQRNKEDFVCDKCGQKNKGNGYTNHCFKCLYSKHVDINPGDRAGDCGGLMQPIDTYYKNNQNFITHKCQKCEHLKNNKLSKNDSFDEFVRISSLKT